MLLARLFLSWHLRLDGLALRSPAALLFRYFLCPPSFVVRPFPSHFLPLSVPPPYVVVNGSSTDFSDGSFFFLPRVFSPFSAFGLSPSTLGGTWGSIWVPLLFGHRWPFRRAPGVNTPPTFLPAATSLGPERRRDRLSGVKCSHEGFFRLSWGGPRRRGCAALTPSPRSRGS